ncbi:MAG: 5-formyltetrahydrofolate cyclo-ligase [Deltaproteobacteria bacterium]|nr:5-formyltetrahydrofolate cyclo-ligase [Deltaproteobacteria bacterium]
MNNKSVIRSSMLECRKTMDAGDYRESSTRVQALFLQSSLYKGSRSIMCYLSVNNEPDTAMVMADAFESGKIVLLPYMREDSIYPVLYRMDMPLKRGRYGIQEPAHPEFFLEKRIDVVIVPGIAFDFYGSRIGYGKGYYDRFLCTLDKKTIKAGFSFKRCVVDKIKNNKWDIPVDVVFTETDILTKEQRV